jgi:NAD(P)-dependent dehydrogenase (short-subunit alcohol dehydrogenase family)
MKPPKIALITGATGGIGYATAHHLIGAGWHVWGAGLPSDDFTPLQKLGAHPLAMDITDEAHVRKGFARVYDTHGRLDALVNAVGVQAPAPLEHLPIEALERTFAVNVAGHLRVVQHALPLLKSSKGRIVAVSSLMGKVAFPMLGAYSMSKHALEAMCDALRLELAPFGVSVCLVAMGAVDTPMAHNMDALLKEARANHPEAHDYGALYDALAQTLAQQAQSAISPQAVANAIVRTLNARTPKPRVVVDTPTWGLTLMRRLAPLEVADRILARALRLRLP